MVFEKLFGFLKNSFVIRNTDVLRVWNEHTFYLHPIKLDVLKSLVIEPEDSFVFRTTNRIQPRTNLVYVSINRCFTLVYIQRAKKDNFKIGEIT